MHCFLHFRLHAFAFYRCPGIYTDFWQYCKKITLHLPTLAFDKKTNKQSYFLAGGAKFSKAKNQVLFQCKLDSFSQLYVDSSLLVTFSLLH